MLSEADAKAAYRKQKAEIAARKLELAIQRAENLAATGGDMLSETDAKAAYRRPTEIIAPLAPAVASPIHSFSQDMYTDTPTDGAGGSGEEPTNDVTEGALAIPPIILESAVMIKVWRLDGILDFSLGTLVEGGIVTHDHFNGSPYDFNKGLSWDWMISHVSQLRIMGSSGSVTLSMDDLKLQEFPYGGSTHYGPGTTFIPLAGLVDLASIGEPAIVATELPKPGDLVYFVHHEGINDPALRAAIPFFEPVFDDYLDVGVGTIWDERNFRTEEFLLTEDFTDPGDSGGGHFNSDGQLIGNLRGTHRKSATFGHIEPDFFVFPFASLLD
jgi:hypothetical protein